MSPLQKIGASPSLYRNDGARILDARQMLDWRRKMPMAM